MRPSNRRRWSFLAAAVVLWAVTEDAWAQGSGSSRLSPPRQTRPQTPAEFQQSFWRHIRVKSPYRDWQRWPAGADEPQPATAPHGPWAKTYAKPAGSKDPSRLGYGSILVQEEYDDDKTTLKAVSVMYCVKGTDPAHYDWYWLKYSPDGRIMRAPADQGGKPIAGKVQTCISCHTTARADLVFSNDDIEASEQPRSSERE